MAEQAQQHETPWLTPEEAGAYIRLSPRTLERLRREGRGPRYEVSGAKKIVYHIDDLDAFIRQGGAGR